MAYEKVKLVCAAINGDIYMARVDKGVMTNSRRVATEDVLAATTEWFIKNKKKMIGYKGGHKLFYTKDEDKAKRILEILEEE